MAFPCLVLGYALFIMSVPMLLAGFLMGKGHRRVLDVGHPLLFWMGRDRVVLAIGRTLMVVGVLLLLVGAYLLYLGYTASPPH